MLWKDRLAVHIVFSIIIKYQILDCHFELSIFPQEGIHNRALKNEASRQTKVYLQKR